MNIILATIFSAFGVVFFCVMVCMVVVNWRRKNWDLMWYPVAELIVALSLFALAYYYGVYLK